MLLIRGKKNNEANIWLNTCSSQQKRQQTKNVSPKRLPPKMNFQSHVNEREEIQKVTRDSIIDASVDTLSSSVADTSSITKTDDTLTSAGENIIPVFFCFLVAISNLSGFADRL